MRKGLFILVLAIAISVVMSMPVHAKDTAAGKVRVFVSIPPIAYFVQRVGGTHVQVNVLMRAGQDPHTFDPSPQLMVKLGEAQVLFKLGFPFEEALVKKIGSAFKNVEVVDLQQGIKLLAMTEEEEHEHGRAHGDKHGHSHDAGDMDPHTWLDPQRAKIQARTIADALIRIDPDHQADYEKNLQGFQADLDHVHAQLTKALAPVRGKSFFVFHPAFGYFGDAYGLKQIPVELEGKEPTGRQLARLIELAKKDRVRIIFVQPEFSKKSAEALANAIGGAAVPLDPLATDYLKNLQDMADALESALSGQRK